MSNQLDMTPEHLFLAWYDKYADKLFRYCLFRIYDRERAKELTQQVFLNTWEYLRSGRTIDSPQAFLYRIATNLMIDAKHKHQQPPVSLDELVEKNQEPVTNSSEKNIIMSLEAERILSCIDELEPSYKEVLLMRYVDDLGPKDIAAILGETQNVISVRIHRGKAHLKTILKKSQSKTPEAAPI